MAKQRLIDANQARETATIDLVVHHIDRQPTIDAIPRDVLLKRLFPLGIPRTREEWNYSINARAVYAAIMKEV